MEPKAKTHSAGTGAFIYAIVNKTTGRVYVGSTNRVLRTRWLEHQKRLRNNDHKNIELQADWNATGKHNFVFKLLKRCALVDMEKYEQAYRNAYAKKPAGVYNTGTDTATPFKGRNHSDETKKKIRQSLLKTLTAQAEGKKVKTKTRKKKPAPKR